MGKSPIVIIISAVCVVACVAAVTVGVSKFGHHGEASDNNGGGEHKLNSGTKAIQSICRPTRYKEACESTLRNSAGNTSDPKELVKTAFRVAKDEITKALERSRTIKAAKDDPRAAEGLEICKEVVGYAINDLERTVDSVGAFDISHFDDFLEDLRVWIGGAITYQEVCFEAFENSTSDAGTKMRSFFNVSRELSSNALNIITEAKSMLSYLDIPGFDLGSMGGGGGGDTVVHRRLLAAASKGMWVAGEMPAWVSDPKRKMMETPVGQLKADAVVAQDGSGQYKTIGEAIKLVPNGNPTPFIIYVKAGTYKEYITIEKKQINVILVGDGATKTIITGNKNFAAGVNTFRTSTVGVLGDGFMARDIGFENTAGAEGHQAVAIRVVSDLAILYKCAFTGYQDTLYAVRGRQFYRDCTVSGTIDFIFGDAQAVFQNCKLLVRKPGPNQQCMVTAQGRTEEKGPGGFVFQGCTITGEPDYMPVKAQYPAYLGRPWKEYSRTIFMNSNIDDTIMPAGWTEWRGNFALDTLFYAEYQNKGTGSDTSKRVKWAGIKTLTPQQAEEFTPAKLFVTADKWIPPSGVPYASGIFSGTA
ncbi:pectinesterase-like [Amaranthus tricolor]|uniref:pectinesterase-like n=1 Tax=Amaranthus tricolor TaxID=29722 RepID=UPI0025836915|nr:pectinesterase-like [Amaranthus tricolor]